MRKCISSIKPIVASAALWLILLSNICSRAQTPQEQAPLTEMPAKVYNKVAPVVVKILAERGNKVGSGAVVGVTPEGRAVILTACHVVVSNFDEHERDPDLPLEFHRDLQVKIGLDSLFIPAIAIAEPKWFDSAIDVALIVTRARVSHAAVIRYNRSDGIKPGQKVAAFGFPESDALTQTGGLITRLEEKDLVFDAKIVPGNSGGPLIDKHGRMIGLSVKTVEGKGYARPMSLVLSIVDGWLSNMKLQTRWERQKYVSIWQRMYRDPVVLASEVGVLGGGGYFLLRPPPTDEPIFPAAPGPPSGQ